MPLALERSPSSSSINAKTSTSCASNTPTTVGNQVGRPKRTSPQRVRTQPAPALANRERRAGVEADKRLLQRDRIRHLADDQLGNREEQRAQPQLTREPASVCQQP
jgi:hypothetical protein